MAARQIQMGKRGAACVPVTLIEGDSSSQIIRLNVQRYEGGVDLAPLSWVVTAENSLGATEEYPVSETIVDNGTISMQWLVRGTATACPGMTRFKLTGCADEGGAVIWQSGEYHLRVDETFVHTSGSEEQQALTEVQRLIIYVDGELNGVISAGEDAAAAAEAAEKAASDALEAAAAAREAANIASTGVESVEQTAASADDGGVNEITVTLTNGEKSTFQVRNGSKGSKGATGESGVYVGSETPTDPEVNVWIDPDGESYTLPTASAETLGGVKVGEGLQMDGDVLGVAPVASLSNMRKITEIITEEEVGTIELPFDTKYRFIRTLISFPAVQTSVWYIYIDVRTGKEVSGADRDYYGNKTGCSVNNAAFIDFIRIASPGKPLCALAFSDSEGNEKTVPLNFSMPKEAFVALDESDGFTGIKINTYLNTMPIGTKIVILGA